ncbi:hypothetical protein [Mangrovimonas sp. ST2L15]|uniref:hypothetical protein n=1 Tax=Mangrovimonas sp. ST2L15 TaxID=1645916 RepID=UPI0006B602B4|nr:hypothetical protein [Mangrovimonas sp. ST2L15]
MKNSILLLFVLSVITFSCSDEGVNDSIEQDLNLGKSNYMVELTNRLSESQEFKEIIADRQLQKKGEGNGLGLLSDGYSLTYFAITEEELIFIGGLGTIQQMPNGKAKFSIHTTDPSGAILSIATFMSTHTSTCVDGPQGTFNYNLISEYEELELFPGYILYLPTGVNASAESANGHCNVNNAVPIYDETYTWVGCTDPTDSKVISLNNGSLSVN